MDEKKMPENSVAVNFMMDDFNKVNELTAFQVA